MFENGIQISKILILEDNTNMEELRRPHCQKLFLYILPQIFGLKASNRGGKGIFVNQGWLFQ